MFAKSLLPLAALFVVACSDGVEPHDMPQVGGSAGAPAASAGGSGFSGGGATAGSAGATAGSAGATVAAPLTVPAGIEVSARVGNNAVFHPIALTLGPGPSGTELYAAVRNDGDITACGPSFSVELQDQDEQAVAAGISGLNTRRFYRLPDGSVAGCLMPGDVTMVAITKLNLDTPIADVRHIVYQSTYWWFPESVAIDGVSLSQVAPIERGTGVAYSGALLNGLDVALDHPTVAVFPIDAAGRPLGVAYGGAMLEVPPGDSWDFETNTVNEAGVGFDAYPMGGP